MGGDAWHSLREDAWGLVSGRAMVSRRGGEYGAMTLALLLLTASSRGALPLGLLDFLLSALVLLAASASEKKLTRSHPLYLPGPAVRGGRPGTFTPSWKTRTPGAGTPSSCA